MLKFIYISKPADDSGSAGFDDDGKLWHEFDPLYHFIIRVQAVRLGAKWIPKN